MKELFVRGSYALFPDRFLRRSRPDIHARPVCRSKKRLTNQEFMPLDYYTSYIPFITATPKDDFIPLGSTNRNKVGGRKLLPTSRIVLCIAETMKNKVALCLTGLLCFMLFNLSDAWAQSAETRAAEGQNEIKPLQIGDTIPEEVWYLPLQVVNHPEGKDTITLNDYRGKKLIILDFWSSWCGPCIRSLPHINKLYDERQGDFSIFLVTRDDPDRIAEFERRIEGDYKQRIPYVKNSILESYFPFKSLPQNVWINNRGLVVSIAMGDIITSQNVDILNR